MRKGAGRSPRLRDAVTSPDGPRHTCPLLACLPVAPPRPLRLRQDPGAQLVVPEAPGGGAAPPTMHPSSPPCPTVHPASESRRTMLGAQTSAVRGEPGEAFRRPCWDAAAEEEETGGTPGVGGGGQDSLGHVHKDVLGSVLRGDEAVALGAGELLADALEHGASRGAGCPKDRAGELQLWPRDTPHPDPHSPPGFCLGRRPQELPPPNCIQLC